MGSFLGEILLRLGMISGFFLAAVLIGILFAKYVYFGKPTICKSKRRLQGTTAIVTGASSGIGKETAKDLACRGARVILACRNRKKTMPVIEEIKAFCGHDNVLYEELDLSNYLSISRFADRINKQENSVDILVNNAGINSQTGEKTVQGIELTFATNHLGPFLLTHLLLDKIQASAPARIVNVSSLLHKLGFEVARGLRFDMDGGQYKYLKGYGISKLSNVLHAKGLAERLRGTGVSVYSLHPGTVYTNIWTCLETIFPGVVARFIHAVFRFVMWTNYEGAQTSIYCAVDDTLEGVSGKYFSNCKAATPSHYVNNKQMIEDLWQASLDLTGLKSE